MFKKIYLSAALSCISMTTLCIPTNQLNEQLMHIQAQIKAVLRAWQKSELTLQELKKLNPKLYARIEPTANKIISYDDIPLNRTVNEQLEAIVNQQKPFAFSLLNNKEPKMSKIAPYLRALCVAIGDRKTRLILWQKLIKKEKELVMALKMAKNRQPQ